jgi:hypothetical protein
MRTPKSIPERILDDSLKVCPTSLTSLTNQDCWLFEITFSNIDPSATRTVNVASNESTPTYFRKDFPLAAISGVENFRSEEGIKFSGGIQVSASGANVNYSITAYAKGMSG